MSMMFNSSLAFIILLPICLGKPSLFIMYVYIILIYGIVMVFSQALTVYIFRVAILNFTYSLACSISVTSESCTDLEGLILSDLLFPSSSRSPRVVWSHSHH